MRPHTPTRLSGQRGYTVVELIVSMTIFSIVLISAIGIFISVANSTMKTTAQRKVQQDIRYSIEELARQVRSSSINYAFYKNNATGVCSMKDGRVLALTTTEVGSDDKGRTRNVYYYYPGVTGGPPGPPAVYRYQQPDFGNETELDTCGKITDPANLTRVTAENVSVTATSFMITPKQNPYAPGFENAAYRNVHPRVTISVTAATSVAVSPGVTERSRYSEATLQTSISTRSYPVDKPYGQPAAAPPPPPAPVPAGPVTYSYLSCNKVPPDWYDCAVDPGDGGVYSYQNFEASYNTSNNVSGKSLSITYKNQESTGVLVQPYSYRVEIIVNGQPPVVVNLPVQAPTGDTRTYVVPGLTLPSGPTQVILRWTNNYWVEPERWDPNLKFLKVEAVR